MVFNYFAVEILEKTIDISCPVAAAICTEFHKGDTSGSAVAASSGLPVLWNFDQIPKKVAFIFLANFVLSVTFLLHYVSKLSDL